MRTYIELFAGLSPLSEILPWKNWKPALLVEKDNYANQIREALHPFTRKEARVIEDINDVDKLPPCDLLLAGFPCQPYSSVCSRKGFDDPRGSVFAGCTRYISEAKPDMFLLENVVGLLTIVSGRAFPMSFLPYPH